MLSQKQIAERLSVLKSMISHAERDLATGDFEDVRAVMELEIVLHANEYRTLQCVLDKDNNMPLQYASVIPQYIVKLSLKG